MKKFRLFDNTLPIQQCENYKTEKDLFVNANILSYSVLSEEGENLGTLNIKVLDWESEATDANFAISTGSRFVLTAKPADGYKLDHWEGDATGNANPISLTMDSDKTVRAVFVIFTQVDITGPNGRITNVTSAATLDDSWGGSLSTTKVIDGDITGYPGTFIEWPGENHTFTFNLDNKYSINSFLIWNDRNKIDAGINEFTLTFYDKDNAQVGTPYSSSAYRPSLQNQPTPQVFSLSDEYVDISKIELIAHTGHPHFQVREIEFRGVYYPFTENRRKGHPKSKAF